MSAEDVARRAWLAKQDVPLAPPRQLGLPTASPTSPTPAPAPAPAPAPTPAPTPAPAPVSLAEANTRLLETLDQLVGVSIYLSPPLTTTVDSDASRRHARALPGGDAGGLQA
jgi:hypothetical protein